MAVLATLLQRIFYAAMLLIAVLVLNFSMLHLAPGDIADTIAQASGGADAEVHAEKHGEEKVLQWRRSYDIPPPELALDDERHPAFDRRYGDLPPDVLPCTESLKITVDRVLPYWYD